jgi:mannose-6-phosphate isomerase-like protein (cupin superfamily)
MAVTRIPFGEIEWAQSPTHPLEQKKIMAGRTAALLRFAPGFSDPNPCERSHVLYVLEGVLELESNERVERIAAGEACWIDEGSTHRARNPGGDPALVFIASEI